VNLASFGLIVVGVLLNAGAQLFIKAGTNALGTLLSPEGILPSVLRVATQPFILGGLFLYVVSVGIWIVVLSKVPVSIAYPMLSIGYIVSAFAGYLLFGESLTIMKLAGIGVIIVGVYMLARPA
jgi:Membrane transporters of cations and cationic drugs